MGPDRQPSPNAGRGAATVAKSDGRVLARTGLSIARVVGAVSSQRDHSLLDVHFGSERRAQRLHAPHDPVGLCGRSHSREAVIEGERERADQTDSLGAQLYQPQQTEVIAQIPISRVVVEEISEVE